MKKMPIRVSFPKLLLTVLLIIIIIIAWTVVRCIYLRVQNTKYAPEFTTIYNSVYADTKGKIFLGNQNAVMIVDGQEMLSQWCFFKHTLYIEKINNIQYDDDGKLKGGKFDERIFRGTYRFTKDDTLILRGDLSSKTYKLQRIKLKRYDKDKVPWDKYPLSDQAKQWLFAYE